jgi:hypothetical protein
MSKMMTMGWAIDDVVGTLWAYAWIARRADTDIDATTRSRDTKTEARGFRNACTSMELRKQNDSKSKWWKMILD